MNCWCSITAEVKSDSKTSQRWSLKAFASSLFKRWLAFNLFCQFIAWFSDGVFVCELNCCAVCWVPGLHEELQSVTQMSHMSSLGRKRPAVPSLTLEPTWISQRFPLGR